MSRTAWIVCVLAAVAVGFVFGRHGLPGGRGRADPLDPGGPELQRPIRVEWWEGGTTPSAQFARRFELVPYRIIDGSRCVFDQHDARHVGGDA